jgi:hypothetical protein
MQHMATKRPPSIKHFSAAIESGDIKRVERFIAKGISVNGDLWHESPASCAIRFNHAHIVALLIRHGLDPRCGDDDLFSVAACYKRQDILKLLATAAFDPDRWRGKSRAEVENEADLIYRRIDRDLFVNFPDPMLDEQLRIARLELFDASYLLGTGAARSPEDHQRHSGEAHAPLIIPIC